MKKMLLILMCIVSATSIFAQKGANTKKMKAEYTHAFSRFAKYYNAIQSDSLQMLHHDGGSLGSSWTPAYIMRTQLEVGRIVSFKYIGTFNDERDVDGNPMVYFKVNFDKPAQFEPQAGNGFNGKKAHAVAIALDRKGRIIGEAFLTRSREIDSLLAHY